jgi:hypothetical protein
MERLLRFPKNKEKCVFLCGFHYWYWKTEISIRIRCVLCVSSFHKNMDTHNTHDTPIRICYTVFTTLENCCRRCCWSWIQTWAKFIFEIRVGFRIFRHCSDVMTLKQVQYRRFYLTKVPHPLPRVFLFLPKRSWGIQRNTRGRGCEARWEIIRYWTCLCVRTSYGVK